MNGGGSLTGPLRPPLGNGPLAPPSLNGPAAFRPIAPTGPPGPPGGPKPFGTLAPRPLGPPGAQLPPPGIRPTAGFHPPPSMGPPLRASLLGPPAKGTVFTTPGPRLPPPTTLASPASINSTPRPPGALTNGSNSHDSSRAGTPSSAAFHSAAMTPLGGGVGDNIAKPPLLAASTPSSSGPVLNTAPTGSNASLAAAGSGTKGGSLSTPMAVGTLAQPVGMGARPNTPSVQLAPAEGGPMGSGQPRLGLATPTGKLL